MNHRIFPNAQRMPSYGATFSLLVAFHIFLTTLFYITLPHSSHIASNLLWLWGVVTGLIIGLYGRLTLIRDILIFYLVTSSITVIVHFLAAAYGIKVDMSTIHAWPFVLLLYVINLLFGLTGGALGWNFRRFIFHRFTASREVDSINNSDSED